MINKDFSLTVKQVVKQHFMYHREESALVFHSSKMNPGCYFKKKSATSSIQSKTIKNTDFALWPCAASRLEEQNELQNPNPMGCKGRSEWLRLLP